MADKNDPKAPDRIVQYWLNEPAIYAIENAASGMVYVGQAVMLRRRVLTHFSRLRRGAHGNPHLQLAFTKYGEGAFRVLVLERCDPDILVEREQFWIDHFGLTRLYNIAPLAAKPGGVPKTPEARARISIARKGKPLSEGHRKKLSDAAKRRTSRHHSDETRRKLSLAGLKMSPEKRAKITAACRAALCKGGLNARA